jgi:hypothetical protein
MTLGRSGRIACAGGAATLASRGCSWQLGLSRNHGGPVAGQSTKLSRPGSSGRPRAVKISQWDGGKRAASPGPGKEILGAGVKSFAEKPITGLTGAVAARP